MKKLLFLIFTASLFVSISHAGDHSDFSFLLEQARNGDVEAMCDIGQAYFNGENTLKDPFRAKCWIKKAHAEGSMRAKKLWNTLELWNYPGECRPSFDQASQSRYTRGATYKEPVTGLMFVFIPNGCFMMGCTPSDTKCKKNETPVHRVCLNGFWMGKYEVSQKQWHQIMGQNPSRFTKDSSHPVENVSFEEVQEFIQRLNSQTRQNFSLPTEAQWEYACRNGGKKNNPDRGNDAHRPYANCGTCNSGPFHGETAPVGSYSPNGLGLYDMSGNVKEWCEDIYDKKAYAKHKKNNPAFKGKGSSRVVRGGSFSDNTSRLRCTSRDKSIPGMGSDNTGFRLVLNRDN